jgi:translation initiation factor IF-2
VAAAKIKVIELAKELGVTSKDLMVAAEEMGHKRVRAMSPLDSALANALRVKLGKGRDLPEAPKPKRVPKPKTDEAGDGRGRSRREKPASRSKKAKTEDDVAADVKPAATIVKPKPAGAVPDIAPQPPFVPEPEPEIVPSPPWLPHRPSPCSQARYAARAAARSTRARWTE